MIPPTGLGVTLGLGDPCLTVRVICGICGWFELRSASAEADVVGGLKWHGYRRMPVDYALLYSLTPGIRVKWRSAERIR
jgi:hypothetical protein